MMQRRRRLRFPVLTSEAECLCFANITVNAGDFFFFLVDVGVWSLFPGAGFASRSTLSHLIALVALVFPVYFRAALVG